MRLMAKNFPFSFAVSEIMFNFVAINLLGMADDNMERYINPYTDFGFKKLLEQAEIARYSESERRQYEVSASRILNRQQD